MKKWILKRMGFTSFVVVENLVGKDILIAACFCYPDAQAACVEAKKRWPHLQNYRVERHDD